MDSDERPRPQPIRTQLDLEDFWHELMGPLGFSGASVWLLIIGPDDHPVPQALEIAECDGLPDRGLLDGFGDFLRRLTDDLVPGARVAMLRTHPGRNGLTDEDRAWAAGLYAATRAAGVPCEVIHVADDAHLLPVPLDELRLPHSA